MKCSLKMVILQALIFLIFKKNVISVTKMGKDQEFFCEEYFYPPHPPMQKHSVQDSRNNKLLSQMNFLCWIKDNWLHQLILKKLASFLFKSMGWKSVPPPTPSPTPGKFPLTQTHCLELLKKCHHLCRHNRSLYRL